jgi:rod shape-determining protein MreD
MGPVNKTIIVLILGLVAVFIQGTLLKSIVPETVIPDLSLILVVYLAFYDSTALGAVLSFLLGLEFDLFSEVLIGPRAGSYVVVYGILASLSQRIFVESPFAAFVSVFMSSLLNSVVYLLLISGFKTTDPHIISVSLVEGVITAFLGPFFLRFLKMLLYKRSQSLTGGFKAVQV